MGHSNGHQIEALALDVMRRQQRRESVPRFSLLRRWREARYQRALATAPVDALITALTEARNELDGVVRSSQADRSPHAPQTASRGR
jgi:hypothetical protein